MLKRTKTSALVAAGLLAGVVFAGAAFAGECPADQVMSGARTSGETMAKGVTDTVIASIDLSSKGGDFTGYMLRMRRLVIEPGGVVPWHMHNERAANILILEGQIEEYRSNCKVPIVHKAGDVTAEFGADLAHWWMNKSKAPVVIISADLLPPQMEPADSM
jgi:quercetin dioxygenase-like cupin family protein